MSDSGPLYSTLRFIGRHVRGFWAAVATFVTLALVAATVLVAALVYLARTISTGFTENVDARALLWIAEHRNSFLDEAMRQATRLGDGIVVIAIAFACAAFLWLTRHRWSVFLLLVGVVGGQIVNNLLKLAFNRPRPDVVDVVTEVRTLSFPSGHATAAVVAYGTIAFLISRLESSPQLRRTTWLIAAVVIIAIGFSRMYLGVHYPTDILGGFVAGAAWLAFVVAIMRAIQFYAPRRPGTAAEERDLYRDV